MRTLELRAWHWVMLLQLLGAVAAPGAQAQTPAGQPAAPQARGSYLGSYLMAPKAEGSCPPDIAAIYQADVIVTGTDMRQRPWGFAQTLRAVLVKASGDPRLKDDPRTADLADHAGEFAVCFTYADMMAGIPLHDDQGTYDRPHKLTVTFDPAKIDTILARFGDKPWLGERPVVVPLLLVHGPKPPPYLLSADAAEGGEQRRSFTTWATELDMKLRIPGEAELAAWGAAADHIPDTAPASSQGEVIVAGTLDWSETLPGWVGRWRCRWRGVDHAWSISGVNYDAAFRDLIGGVMLLASGNGTPNRAGN